MKLPWVSRDHNDTVVRIQDAMIDRLTAQHTELLSRFTMLKLQGFAEPAAPQQSQAVAPEPPADPVEMAIVRQSRGNHRLAGQMRIAAARERMLGVPDAEIAEHVYGGTSTNERAAL